MTPESSACLFSTGSAGPWRVLAKQKAWITQLSEANRQIGYYSTANKIRKVFSGQFAILEGNLTPKSEVEGFRSFRQVGFLG